MYISVACITDAAFRKLCRNSRQSRLKCRKSKPSPRVVEEREQVRAEPREQAEEREQARAEPQEQAEERE